MREHPTCENTPPVKLPVTRKVCTKKVLKEIQNLPGELENLFGRTSAHPRPRPGSVSAQPVRTLISQSLLKMKYWNWIDFNWMWTMWLQGQAWRHTWGKITSAGHPWSQRPGSGFSAQQQVRTQVAPISPLTLSLLDTGALTGVGMAGTNEETPVVAPKQEEVVKLSNSFKEACVITKSELVCNWKWESLFLSFLCQDLMYIDLI